MSVALRQHARRHGRSQHRSATRPTQGQNLRLPGPFGAPPLRARAKNFNHSNEGTCPTDAPPREYRLCPLPRPNCIVTNFPRQQPLIANLPNLNVPSAFAVTINVCGVLWVTFWWCSLPVIWIARQRSSPKPTKRTVNASRLG